MAAVNSERTQHSGVKSVRSVWFGVFIQPWRCVHCQSKIPKKNPDHIDSMRFSTSGLSLLMDKQLFSGMISLQRAVNDYPGSVPSSEEWLPTQASSLPLHSTDHQWGKKSLINSLTSVLLAEHVWTLWACCLRSVFKRSSLFRWCDGGHRLSSDHKSNWLGLCPCRYLRNLFKVWHSLYEQNTLLSLFLIVFQANLDIWPTRNLSKSQSVHFLFHFIVGAWCLSQPPVYQSIAERKSTPRDQTQALLPVRQQC